MRYSTMRVILPGIIGLLPSLHAHDNLTIHPMLTDKAYEIWSQQVDNTFFEDLAIDPSIEPDWGIADESDSLMKKDLVRTGLDKWTDRPWTLKKWLMAGSIDEDAPDTRCLAHFYNPLPVDNTHSLTDPIHVSGRDSFAWATKGESFTPPLIMNLPPTGTNSESWNKSRLWYFRALTSAIKDDREENLAHTFYALGKVSHLLQDLSQPEHVRNDAHAIDGDESPGPLPKFIKKQIFANCRWIEAYGHRKIDEIALWSELKKGNTPALDWSAAGFVRVEDFWNRHIYTGRSDELDDDASGSKRLGLSEFINGNFLGADASYGNIVDNQGIHYFPHPILEDTNVSGFGVQGAIQLTQTWISAATVNPVTSRSRKSVFLKKEHSGVAVEKHSILNYSELSYGGGGRAGGRPISYNGQGAVTINAPDVMEQYHKIVLPKAVQYTSGLMDYFFRGKLGVRIRWNEEDEEYKLDITNKSGDSLKGGAFTLYADDSSDARTAVSSLEVKVNGSVWDSNSILEDGDAANATFTPSSTQSKGFMLVYKGTIGLDSGGTRTDEIDEGKAIAAYHFQLLRFHITWDINSDIDLYLTDPNGDVIWYDEKVSSLGELDIDDGWESGGTGPENITLKQLVPGDYKVWANFYRDWYPNDYPPDGVVTINDPSEVTSVNVEMKTYYNSSTPLDTDEFELLKPNRADVDDLPTNIPGRAILPSWYVRNVVTVDENGVVTEH